VAEAIYRQAALRGVCVTILRPRLIIGPGRLGVLRRLFDRVRDDKAIPVVGDPKNRYQMVSVRDVAAACLLALRDSVAGTFNLGSDNPPGVRDLIRTLRDRAGSSSRIVTVPRAAAHAGLWLLESARCAPLRAEQFRLTGRDCVLDTTRARDLLGWRPQDSDVEMLCQAYRAYVERAADFSRRG
jgi:dTDP-glucose 4,6-dehydratase